MADNAELSFQITYRWFDLFKATFDAGIRRPRLWAAAVLIALGVVMASGAFCRDIYDLLLVFFSSVVGFGGFAILVRAIGTTRFPGALSPILFAFSDAGVRVKYANAMTEANWPLVTGAFETATFIFVSVPRGSLFPVPKAQLTIDQIDRLKEILRRHVSRKLRLRP